MFCSSQLKKSNMPPVHSSNLVSLDILQENPKEVFLEITSLLLRLVNNVIANPTNPKFRSIRLANRIVVEKLIPVEGAMECLFEIGFQEADDSLILPGSVSLDDLKRISTEILSRRDNVVKGIAHVGPSATSSRANVSASAIPATTTPAPSTAPVATPISSHSAPSPSSSGNTTTHANPAPKITPEAQQTTKNPRVKAATYSDKESFLSTIAFYSETMIQCTDKKLLEQALNCVPLDEIQLHAQEKMREVQRAIKKEQADQNATTLQETEPCFQELLLVQLLKWFKEDFFSWVDSPKCDLCSAKTKFSESRIDDDVRVEMYQCTICSNYTSFPRYNNAAKLLESRRGRCGEWGRCFSLLCTAMGWDSRFVVDATDHVWTEVFFPLSNRWVHCDPCEGALDTPLMYEKGWKKKLTYIMAYSVDDVQDVTWRYTCDFKEVLKRRSLCSEMELVDTIMKIRAQRQQHLSTARKSYLSKRSLMEVCELMKEPKSEGDYQGRQSGSLAWRISRGETRSAAAVIPYIWRPNDVEIERGEMRIQYDMGLDIYSRGPGVNEPPIQGWQNGVKEIKDIFRKTEKDWNKVYLSRIEGTEKGHIAWAIDLANTNMEVDTVQLVCHTSVFESGKAVVQLCGGECCICMQPGEHKMFTEALRASSSLTLTVDLMGGNGKSAWQHSQLFRSDIGTKTVTLDLLIKLRRVS